MILALDTSGAVSVAVGRPQGDDADGPWRTSLVASEHRYDPRRHAELLMPMVKDALAQAASSPGGVPGDGPSCGVQRIVVGVGPGPFTGLRVAMASAVVLGETWGVPVQGLCSLDAMAAQVVARRMASSFASVIVAADARRREVYWAQYAPDGSCLVAPRVEKAGDVEPVGDGPILAVGRGAHLYSEEFAAKPGVTVYESAEHDDPMVWDASGAGLLQAADLADAGVMQWRPIEPLYLREPDAKVPTTVPGIQGASTP